MKKLFRALLAGWGAKKIGGGRCGCIGVIIVFIVLYYLLGYVFK
jgi:sugar phosphate permease